MAEHASRDKKLSPAEQALREAALDYHRYPVRGKISITPTKPLSNQRDLSLAYSPGVAYACLAIADDPTLVAEYTSRSTWWAWSPTAPRCWGWATSARWPASR
jgi:malic enzyme